MVKVSCLCKVVNFNISEKNTAFLAWGYFIYLDIKPVSRFKPWIYLILAKSAMCIKNKTLAKIKDMHLNVLVTGYKRSASRSEV